MTGNTIAIQPAVSPEIPRSRGFWEGAWRRFRRNLLAIFGMVVVIAVVLMAVFASQIAPYEYDTIQPIDALQGPSSTHPFGTDTLGRDMLSRIIYAARPMLIVGVVTQLVGVLIGAPLGLIAGYTGGMIDWLVTRLIDLFSALPWYLIVLYLVMVLSPSLENLVLALTITSWVGSARIVRAITMATRERDYILAAQVVGASPQRIMIQHVLPQVLPLLVWSFAVGIPVAIFAEAGLSFIGMGIRPPQPSWGQMLAEAGSYWQYSPHMVIFPSLMITLSVLAFQLLADGVREALDVRAE